MKEFKTVNFKVYSDGLGAQIEEVHTSRLSREDKQKALIELGLKKEDLRVIYDGIYYNPFAPIRVTTKRGRSYTFGVEIECFVSQQNIALRARDNGMVYQYESYNHTDSRDHYKFVRDASVCGMDDAIECVSPILRGNNGFASLRATCKTLNEAGAQVNRTCGLHIHIGASELNDREIINVFKNYAKLEDVIDSFMAPSRRNNIYAKSLRGINMEVASMYGLYNAFNGSRYYKVNPFAYQRHKTIEFRQHGGSTNFKKIESWIKFLIKLVDWSRNNVLEANVQSISEIPFLTDKEKRFFEARKAELVA